MVVFGIADQDTIKAPRPLFYETKIHTWLGLLPFFGLFDMEIGTALRPALVMPAIRARLANSFFGRGWYVSLFSRPVADQ